MAKYNSRAVLLMTGNALPTEAGAILKRILTIRYYSSVRVTRRSKAKTVKEEYEKLRPIGFWLLRNYIAKNHSLAELLKTIKEYTRLIELERTNWESPQRAVAWAVVYLGLKIMEAGCKAKEVSWKAPTIKHFVESVVDPVERSTWDSKRTKVERFISWFEMWLVQHTRTVNLTIYDENNRGHRDFETEIQGEDDVWKEEPLTVSGKPLTGYWITNSMLDEYNKHAPPEENVPNIKELAVQAAGAAGIPVDHVLDTTGQVVRTVFGEKQKRAAFLAMEHMTMPIDAPHAYSKTDDASKAEAPVSEECKTTVDTNRQGLVLENREILDDSRNISLDKKTIDRGVAREGGD